MNTRNRYALAFAFSLLGCAGASVSGAPSASPSSGANSADGRVAAAPFGRAADADAIAFHVLAKHPSGTTMDWSGSVKGDSVDGTATRTMNDKTDILRFKGSLSGR